MSPLLYGLAVGGAAMYFFDPERGRRRRALVRDKAAGASNCARDFVDAGTRDLKHRGSVLTGRIKSRFTRRGANDQVLVERVRSVMGHHVLHPGAIDVYAAGGKVTLNGSILSHEHPELLESVGAVSGVNDVIDQLAVYERAEGISELQDGREPHAGRSQANPKNWSPGAQLVAGAALGLYLLRHSSRLRGLFYLAAAGAAMLRLSPREQVQHLADTMTPEAPEGREANETRATAEEAS